ncbi:MAG TPA: BsuBI/PstI family type II restriction endonuclease [Gemmatimonadaceae bacterium]|nr:MAG: restriction endonuclease [Acidobacteriota bacterium]HTD83071.1 BsuBI/PstI family type II restriction endonuclease [Gemmatimonadaceae bacterium]
MAKLEDAKEILKALGLPPKQQNDVAAYTLLALAGMRERSRWSAAERRPLRIHDMIVFTNAKYRVPAGIEPYKENTRETFRRQAIHQFEQARVVDRNADDLATNSPNTQYALSNSALEVIRSYGTKQFAAEAAAFRESHGSLLAVYTASKRMHLVPVKLADGRKFTLSPGKHNQVQAAVVGEFAARFVPGSTILYFGDTAKKTLILEEDALRKLCVPITKHDKLPDIVLYDKSRNWLFLIEAVTSHGPVSPKRKLEMERALKSCTAERIYVSAFPDFKEFRRHIDNIAWETEVWIAENPDHMIHFNGDKFLGPAT